MPIREASLARLRQAGLTVPSRVRLAQLPTRVERLDTLSAELGLDLWVKRDDETGTELSGNKVRKLEYLLAEARAQDADVVLTCGGVQSNHCRATAIAARRLGLDAVLFLRGSEPATVTGNLLLDRLVGAEVRYVTAEEYARRNTVLATAAEELRRAGRRPYVIPEGGSNALGSWGYVELIAEIAAAMDGGGPWDHVVCATGSGGTLAGLTLGQRLLAPTVPWLERTRTWGVPVCDDGAYFQRKVVEIAAEFAERFGSRVSLPPDDVGVIDGYKGSAYAVPYDEELALIRRVARTEGLLLDPVYTGKAFCALVSEARGGRFRPGERVLFLHTGGVFSLFAYAAELVGA